MKLSFAHSWTCIRKKIRDKMINFKWQNVWVVWWLRHLTVTKHFAPWDFLNKIQESASRGRKLLSPWGVNGSWCGTVTFQQFFCKLSPYLMNQFHSEGYKMLCWGNCKMCMTKTFQSTYQNSRWRINDGKYVLRDVVFKVFWLLLTIIIHWTNAPYWKKL